MTISEAHRAFRFGLDKMDALNYPNFLPEEIDLLLNQAQDRFVKQRYSGNNTKKLGVEEDQKRMEDLKAVIKGRQDLFPSKTNNNVNYPTYQFTLPSDHWFMIYERVILNCPGCNQNITYHAYSAGGIVDGVLTLAIDQDLTLAGVYADVVPTTLYELNNVLKDPFREPDNTKVLRLMNEGKIELLIPSTCTGWYYIRKYIKKPTRVSLSGGTTFELSDHTHQEIVDEAVKLALEGIEAKRIQTFPPIVDSNKE
jgi:hypothetical protein